MHGGPWSQRWDNILKNIEKPIYWSYWYCYWNIQFQIIDIDIDIEICLLEILIPLLILKKLCILILVWILIFVTDSSADHAFTSFRTCHLQCIDIYSVWCWAVQQVGHPPHSLHSQNVPYGNSPSMGILCTIVVPFPTTLFIHPTESSSLGMKLQLKTLKSRIKITFEVHPELEC